MPAGPIRAMTRESGISLFSCRDKGGGAFSEKRLKTDMTRQFDQGIINAWNAMNEAVQMSNFASARKIAVSLRPMTMPDWKDKWREFDIMIVEGFGGSFPDIGEIDEIRQLLSKISKERDILENRYQILSDENNELSLLNRRFEDEKQKLESEITALRDKIEKLENRETVFSDPGQSSAVTEIAANLTLARKLNAHLFHLSKKMQNEIERLGGDASLIGQIPEPDRPVKSRGGKNSGKFAGTGKRF